VCQLGDHFHVDHQEVVWCDPCDLLLILHEQIPLAYCMNSRDEPLRVKLVSWNTSLRPAVSEYGQNTASSGEVSLYYVPNTIQTICILCHVS
jgi:hypothetical protein